MLKSTIDIYAPILKDYQLFSKKWLQKLVQYLRKKTTYTRKAISLSVFQKQSPRGVLKKRCSENIQQMYRRTPMPKCNFNKISCKFAAYFQNTVSYEYLWVAASCVLPHISNISERIMYCTKKMNFTFCAVQLKVSWMLSYQNGLQDLEEIMAYNIV